MRSCLYYFAYGELPFSTAKKVTENTGACCIFIIFSTILVKTGEEAVKEVAENREIQIVLMDLELGDGMDGIKSSEMILEKRNLPIVFCTGYSEKEYIKKIKNVSRYGYVLKSAEEAVFVETISIALELFKKEEELKESKTTIQNERERLMDIINGTNAGTWEWNIQTGETVFNEKWAEIIGYKLEELMPISIDTWIKLTHEEDLKKSGELLNKHFNGEIPYYECECRMKHKDGSWVWVIDRGKVTKWGENGKPLMMFGTHQDITKQKSAEMELKKSEEQFRMMVENAPLGIFHFDKECILTNCNEKFEKILGADTLFPDFVSVHRKIFHTLSLRS